MNKIIPWVIGLVIALGGGGYYYYQRANQPVAAPPPLPVAIEEQPTLTPEPEIPSYTPIVEEPPEPEPEPEPLPALADSDAVIAATITSLVGSSAFDQLFNVQEIVQHIVATVDNLPRRKVSQKIIPVKPAAGDFAIEGEQQSLKISTANYDRYNPYIALVTATDTTEVATSYQRFYPLFEEAYAQLGYPDGGFNARLISVIDHLLETPEVAEPVYLIKPEAFYQFEDPDLEALSAGQKALIRMGNNNAAAVKSKLEAFRAAISS